MVQTRRQKLERHIGTITSDQPEVIRERLVEALADAVSCDFALSFRFVQDDGMPHYSLLSFTGQEDALETLSPLVDAPALDVPWLPPNADPGEIETFISPRATYGDHRYFNSELYTNAYHKVETSDELRALFFQGSELLAWVGLIRRGEGNRFRRSEQRALSTVCDSIRTHLVSAQSLDDERLEGGIAATFLPNGRIEHASRAFADWIDTSRRRVLSRRVERYDRGDISGQNLLLDGARVQLIRLDVGDGIRYLTTVEQVPPWQLHPAHRRTERQREVADCAAAGATNDEIARHLDISLNTVKQHLKNIYSRLGIGSRAELADVLSE